MPYTYQELKNDKFCEALAAYPAGHTGIHNMGIVVDAVLRSIKDAFNEAKYSRPADLSNWCRKEAGEMLAAITGDDPKFDGNRVVGHYVSRTCYADWNQDLEPEDEAGVELIKVARQLQVDLPNIGK